MTFSDVTHDQIKNHYFFICNIKFVEQYLSINCVKYCDEIWEIFVNYQRGIASKLILDKIILNETQIWMNRNWIFIQPWVTIRVEILLLETFKNCAVSGKWTHDVRVFLKCML